MHPPDASLLPPSGSRQDPRYPVGRFRPVAGKPAPAERQAHVQVIARLPGQLSAAFAGLTDDQIDTPYREGGWTLRQLAHHVADSHMQAYARSRFALTEDWPTIKPYHQELWAELSDARTLPVEASLVLLTALHGRWIALLASLDEVQWQRGYVHPENGRTTLASMVELYSWHSRHHTAHVTALRERMGW